MQTDRMRDIMKGINRCAARLAFEHRRQNSHLVIYDEMLELHDEMMECLGRADEECALCGEWAAQCRECEESRENESMTDLGWSAIGHKNMGKLGDGKYEE